MKKSESKENDGVNLSYGLFLSGFVIFCLYIFSLDASISDFLSGRIVHMIIIKGGFTMFGILAGAMSMAFGVALLFVSLLHRRTK